MLDIENAISNGSFTTRAKSRLETIKSLRVKHKARREREKWAFNALKTDTSNG